MTAKIRVLIVDDSDLACALLRQIFEDDGGFEVLGDVHNGRDAIAQVKTLKPDLVTMDLEMPQMHGLDAIEAIMSSCAVPILVVSAIANAQNAYAAVARGAVEVVLKPSLDDVEIRQFIAKAKLVSKVHVIPHIRPLTMGFVQSKAENEDFSPPFDRGEYSIFAIASSTGGPQALAHILAALPKDFACPVVIAQHIVDGFAPGLAEWLATISSLPVRLVRDGELINGGTVYLAPSERHLMVTPARRFALVDRKEGDIYHPSCDVLLSSIAEVYVSHAVGIILTGMGRDGARGLEKIRLMGGYTIAQNEETSVVFGMNGVAISEGAVRTVLPVDKIAQVMIDLAGVER